MNKLKVKFIKRQSEDENRKKQIELIHKFLQLSPEQQQQIIEMIKTNLK